MSEVFQKFYVFVENLKIFSLNQKRAMIEERRLMKTKKKIKKNCNMKKRIDEKTLVVIEVFNL